MNRNLKKLETIEANDQEICNLIDVTVECKITTTLTNPFVETLCESNFIFKPTSTQIYNDELTNSSEDYSGTYYHKPSLTSGSSRYSSNYSSNTDKSNSEMNERMPFSEFQYKINNYSEEYFHSLETDHVSSQFSNTTPFSNSSVIQSFSSNEFTPLQQRIIEGVSKSRQGVERSKTTKVNSDNSSKDSGLQYHLDFFTLHKKHEKTQHKQPKIDGLVAVDKSKMKPHAKSWEKSASLPVTITTNNKTDNDYCFMGLEKSGFHTTNGNLVCYKKTGRGVFDGFIKSVPKSEITLPQNSKIEQPWFRSKVCVYENSTIANVFDIVLNQQLQGVSPAATYLQVMTHCIDQGIPIFVVGGAVRDVIYAVLKDKETNVQNILKKVKDINIRFGCPTQEFCQTIARKWPKEPSPPGPRGLVIIGNRACNSFFEGKAISGLNNDTHSVKSYIPQCFGTDLVRDNICRDFTCNSLWYDPINKCIIDPLVMAKELRTF
ncbi:hypothetical protein ABK040_012129 [Willaertia magna]